MLLFLSPGTGSSPLARGLRSQKYSMLPIIRIIPARAGFTLRYQSASSRKEDHPRSRGVYILFPYTWKSVGGSSPLARGLQVDSLLSFYSTGIIPARAGFTRGPGATRTTPPDHPRSRGVYLWLYRLKNDDDGSSPLARGLLQRQARKILLKGIIPARAGFTSHPRARLPRS